MSESFPLGAWQAECPHQLIASNTMALTLVKLFLRSWRFNWLRTLGLICVIALGTSVYLAVDAGNRVAIKSFSEFTDSLAGKDSFTIKAEIGRLSTADLETLQEELRDYEVYIVPRIEVLAVLENDQSSKLSRKFYTIYGLDILSLISFWSQEGRLSLDGQSVEDSPIFSFLDKENTFLSRESDAFAGRDTHNFSIGSQMVELSQDLKLSEMLPEFVPSNVIIMEYEKITGLTELNNQWDAFDVILPRWIRVDFDQLSSSMEVLAAERNWLVTNPEERQEAGAQLTESFRYNLKALSLLSLFVTVMIVFQAMDVAVTKRTREISILYSLGLSPARMRFALFCEVLILGLIGSLMGVFTGVYLAGLSAGVVNKTVSVLYYFSNSEVSLSYDLILESLVFGLMISALGSLFPILAAGKVPKIQCLKNGIQSSEISTKFYPWIAVFFIVTSVVLLKLPTIEMANGHQVPIGGYLMCLFLILGISLISVSITKFLSQKASVIFQGNLVPFIGVSQLRRLLSRHALAITSIVLSVGMTVSIIVLIASFEKTVEEWLDRVLLADVFVRPKTSTHYANSVTLSNSQVMKIVQNDGIEFHGKIYSTKAIIEDEEEKLIGYDVDYLKRVDQLSWMHKPDDLYRLKEQNYAIISESFSSRKNLDVGMHLRIEAKAGEVFLKVLGIYREYGNERGSVGVGMDTYRYISGKQVLEPEALAIHLKEGYESDLWAQNVGAYFQALDVMSYNSLREESLAIFKNVFSVTYALKFIGIFVACGGLASMMFSLIMERHSEIFALRRIGFRNSQIRNIFMIESGMLSFVGSVFGILLGCIMGCILVLVINKQAFGWTLDMSYPFLSIISVGLLVFLSGQFTVFFISRWINELQMKNEE